jgi:hypothetical protein
MTVSPPPSIAFVTGVDAEMFGQLFLLLGSLRRNSPGVWLHVCDLGMNERIQAAFEQAGILIADEDEAGGIGVRMAKNERRR